LLQEESAAGGGGRHRSNGVNAMAAATNWIMLSSDVGLNAILTACTREGTAMPKTNFHPSGRHFLQIPGPGTVPDRILRAISLPTVDHRGPEFDALGRKVLTDIAKIFQTRNPVVIYPASGAALLP
jgi:hypothetical protein